MNRIFSGVLFVSTLLISTILTAQNYDSIPNRFLMNRSIVGSFSTQTERIFKPAELDNFLAKYPLFREFSRDLHEFYQRRNYAYAWFDNQGITEQAYHLYDRVTTMLQKKGKKDTTLYHNRLLAIFNNPITEDGAPEADLMLTGQYLLFGKRVSASEISDNQLKNMKWLIPRSKRSTVDLLNEYLAEEDPNDLNDMVNAQYKNLRAYIRFMEEKGLIQAPAIKPDKSKYLMGDASPVLLKLRERLVQWGDLTSSNGSSTFDSELRLGVQNFQRRHGLTPDGVPGAATFAALNVPGSQRIRQILLNMERYRWMPNDLTGEYLIVNIPEYKLHAYNGERLLWDMNVVVGKDIHSTVIFNGDITYMVMSPYWHIPASIVKRDVLPGMRKNRNYLASRNMEIVGNSGGIPVVRQKPGPNNSLGKVKFMFPNSYNIYLHDSPAKHLFDNTNRAASSGCVRLSDAEFLARYLLRDQPEWTAERIYDAMNDTKETRVDLINPMPVYLAYFTAFVDETGKLNFRSDIYSRDGKLAAMLFN